MERNPTAWTPEEKEAFRREAGKIRDAATRIRYLVILHWAEGMSHRTTARMLKCSKSTVHEVRTRFREEGVAGLCDRRGDNGSTKVTDEYTFRLQEVVSGTPQAYGHRRSTWTQELLVKVMGERTGITISVSAMCRLLRRLGIRRGRPQPTVLCPWPERSRKRRIRWIRRRIETLPATEAAVYEDEMDVHLNPKIGPDYMLPGQQKTVVTPGKNVKQYVAGAMDARTKRVVWIDQGKKSSSLFIALLDRLVRTYSDRTAIHVILDNYVIHHSRLTQQALERYDSKIVLHFLPPYCPDDNRIERLWREVHANVTRNHQCATMDELMGEVRYYLATHNRKAAARLRKAA
jgi:transposase